MERQKILVVEDDPNFRKALCTYLVRDYTVESAGDADAAINRLENSSFDLVIADLGLPGKDGYRLIASIRALEQCKNIPIIILSARTEVEEKLIGFSVGANDFITKPLDPRELIARIQAHTRTAKRQQSDAQEFSVGPFHGHLLRQEISYQVDESKITLTLSPQEFKLLHFFLTHVGHVVTREQLLDKVWGSSRHVNDRSVDALISKTRRKLGPYAHLVESIHGVGYRFIEPARSSAKKTG